LAIFRPRNRADDILRGQTAMKLYFAPQTRAIWPLIMLEELAVPYEIVLVDFKGGEHKTAEYRKIHPHGQLPALQDGTLTMFESAAICAYLADKFPDKRMAPALGTVERGTYYQWMFYSMAALEGFALDRERMKECFLVLDRVLTNREFILGNKITAADVMIGSGVIWLDARHHLLDDFPSLDAYAKRLRARPSFERVFATPAEDASQ
jgi:glutathione S-transferase